MKCQQIASELASGFILQPGDELPLVEPVVVMNVARLAVSPRRLSTRRTWLVRTPSTIGYPARRTNGSAPPFALHWR